MGSAVLIDLRSTIISEVHTKKKLVLHIGSHKTATTFLQSSLAQNPQVLRDLSVLYPTSGQIYEAHFKLCWRLREGKPEAADLETIPEWAALIEEIKASDAEMAILSCEEFGMSIAPHLLEPLKKHFNVSVLCYLRSPDSYLQSFYNQFVKDFITRETRTISTYLNEDRLEFLNNRAILEPWLAVFGRKAVQVRLFETAVQSEGGILGDFLRSVGINRTPPMAPPNLSILQKVSLPPDALEYLRFANFALDIEVGHYPFVVRLVEMSLKYTPRLQTTRAGMLSHRARQSLRYRFSGQNVWLAQTFFDTSHTPFPAVEAPPPPEDFVRRLEEADAATLGRVAAMLHNFSRERD